MNAIISNLGWIVLIVVIIFIIWYKKISKDPNAITSKFVITQTVNPDRNLSNKIMDSLKNSGFRKVRYDSAEKAFYAQSGISMSSWGEYIIINIKEQESVVMLDFMSICAFPFQIFEWGKNEKNYRRFRDEFSKLDI